jgi:hypothetical protein
MNRRLVMFGRAKKRVKADAPATEYEKATAAQEVAKKYPQMSKSDWGKPTAKSNMRTKAVQKGMGDSAGGIKTDEEKEEEREAKFRSLHPGQATSYDKRKARRNS